MLSAWDDWDRKYYHVAEPAELVALMQADQPPTFVAQPPTEQPLPDEQHEEKAAAQDSRAEELPFPLAPL